MSERSFRIAAERRWKHSQRAPKSRWLGPRKRIEVLKHQPFDVVVNNVTSFGHDMDPSMFDELTEGHASLGFFLMTSADNRRRDKVGPRPSARFRRMASTPRLFESESPRAADAVSSTLSAF